MPTHSAAVDAHEGSAGARRSGFAGRQAVAAILTLAIASMIAASWLVFPYFIKEMDLIADVGTDIKQTNLRRAISIGSLLTRTSFGSGEAQLDVLFATPEFFEIAGQPSAAKQYRPDQFLVFLLTETTHTEDLPTQLPRAVLSVDGQDYEAFDVDGPLEVYHHRVVTIRFRAARDDRSPVLGPDARSLSLTLHNTWDPDKLPRVVEWELPLEYPAELTAGPGWSPIMVLGLSAGLLSFVLTPCLLQLLIIYLATLTGLSLGAGRNGIDNATSGARKAVLWNSLAFVAGLTALFTATGAAMGEAGKQLQIHLAQWSPALSIAAGILIIVMGIWVGVRSRAPLVCRIATRMPKAASSNPASCLGSALIAIGFTLGCMTCFGGAIIATLLIYVGSLGSALVGAAVMLGFSMGVGVPFLLAAVFLSRATKSLARLEPFVPATGLVSMLVIVSFGIVLLTGNFHALSDAIYPWLGL